VRTRLTTRLALPALLVAVLAALLAWLIWFWQPDAGGEAAHRRLDLAGEPTGGDFRLQGRDGPVALSDFRGKAVLLYFGYTACPDICPTNLAVIAYALKQLAPAERARVQVVFVSVDPGRDHPERLAEYAAYWDPTFLGVTGTEQDVAAVARQYGAAYRIVEQSGSAMGYLVDHSAFTYVIDAQGGLVATLPHATPAAELLSLLRPLLAEHGE
jgi:protein SCO1